MGLLDRALPGLYSLFSHVIILFSRVEGLIWRRKRGFSASNHHGEQELEHPSSPSAPALTCLLPRAIAAVIGILLPDLALLFHPLQVGIMLVLIRVSIFIIALLHSLWRGGMRAAPCVPHWNTALGEHCPGHAQGRGQTWPCPLLPPSGPRERDRAVMVVRGALAHHAGVTGLVRDHHSHAQETCTRRRKRTKRKGYRTDLFPLQGQGEKREVKKRRKSSWILGEGRASASGHEPSPVWLIPPSAPGS